MITAPTDMRSTVGELQALLDEEIALLDLRRRQLEALSSAVVDRDEDRLEQLLVEMESVQSMQSATDLKLGALRTALAGWLGVAPAKMRLSRLLAELPADQRVAIEYRRQQIVLLADKLRRQHMETAVLLWEFAKVNRRLLEGLLPRSQEVTTYGTAGPDAWRPPTGLTDQHR
jgi:hypothetical protein